MNRMGTTYRTAVLGASLLVSALLSTTAVVAQLPVRAREVRLLSDNNTNYAVLQSPNGLVANWNLVLPASAGTSGSLLTTTVTGNTSTSSWLAPGLNGQVLTITGGVPTWATQANNAWVLTGNAGTTPGTNFIGTTDNQAFEIHVNETGLATEGARRVLRIEPNASSANIIAGHSTNGLGLGTTAVGVTIAGGGSQGQANRGSDDYTTVGGGRFNRAGSNDATPGNAQYATVAGGSVNVASAQGATVAGGESNTAAGVDAAVVGGANNNATGANSFIGGGGTNTTAGAYAAVAGGSNHSGAGAYAAIAGGQNNSIAVGSDYSAIFGGRGLALTGAGSFGFQGNNAAGASNVSIAATNTGYFGNVNLWLGNNDGTARQLRFYEPQATSGAFPAAGTNYVAFQAPVIASTNDQTYTLPSTIGTAGQVLRIATSPAPTATAATLEWGAAGTPLFARRTSDVAYTVPSLVNDGELVISLTANDVFDFEAMVAYDGAQPNADLQVAFTVPAGASIRWSVIRGGNSNYAPQSITASGASISDIPVNSSSPGDDMTVYVRGIVVMGGTAGTLQLQAGTTTASKTVNILTNSFIKATKVN